MNPTSERPDQGRIWTVAALVGALDDLLAARVGTVAVSGEVSALTQAASGHRYFSLKDASGRQALLRCAWFRRAAGGSPVALREGLRIEAVGRLSIYEPRGDLQFIVESVRPLGAGSLHEEFLRLKARLAAQGWFDAQRKRPLPVHPTVIGVVSSLAAAALADILTVIERRAPHVRVVVYPCLVQGEAAPPTIVQALEQAAEHGHADAIILARGGGSLEDLWAFNDERVVRAVAQSPLPVVCGVGHETDVTLADFAADVRAATPTAAAELLTPLRAEELTRLAASARRLSLSLHRTLDRQAQALDQMALLVLRPAQSLSRQSHDLDRRGMRLEAALREPIRLAQRQLERQARRLAQADRQQRQRMAARLQDLVARIESQDPMRVLQRGYAWVSSTDGRALTSVRQVADGDVITAVWHDGRAQARVIGPSIQPEGERG